ncbi:hypothetical protein ACHAXR_010513, partial [Thalassiosira sp. AJA248-18]
LDDVINYEITPFLNENKDAIITIDLETLGDREFIMRDLRVILAQATGFTSRIFRLTDERWTHHTQWPTIQEMRDADQRVLILSDSTIVQSKDLGIMLRGDIVSIESLQRVKPENIGGGDNGWGVLYPRAVLCTYANGNSIKPNYLAVDWAHIGDAHEIADYLNHGGRLGTRQKCRSGLDCATGACSVSKRCHCQICKANCTSGCGLGEECVSIESEDGIHACVSNTGVVHTPSNNADAVQFQGLVFLWTLALLCLLISMK